uniref:Uncharacterized protein n=1 Tax=Arundo donax TaxID=35708 RepID=A0A0A8YVP8_ARUDO
MASMVRVYKDLFGLRPKVVNVCLTILPNLRMLCKPKLRLP